MKPVNRGERSKLYLQFFALYIASIVMIMIAMHFFYSIPEKELQVLRDQQEKFKMYDVGPRKMLANMKVVDSLMILLEDPKSGQEKTESDIKDYLDEIKNIASNKQSSMDSVFIQIRKNYYFTLEEKRKIRESGSQADAFDQLKRKSEKLETDYDACQKELAQLKYLSLSPGRK